ncbi:uncharacterized protein CC84DRAFT_37185 [Paraphaeosphaeria sporulosa]|uniref:Uncharacterized protein n=1 Tax=Paraphaeosphaeria sporulosa TaxID=1460663 RepID=A0A177CV63_9PLEO|nr:uncharacterized protein CC84DRAFT_37185 [Paraphaeosphaeria sporulosa]OAG11445.1 hypothetical protein CC84DRAFT_37185 [Paraphaeosphaeria sporulosa]
MLFNQIHLISDRSSQRARITYQLLADMAERKKLRKRLRDLSHQNDFLNARITTLMSENATLTSRNAGLNANIVVLRDTNVILVQQLRDAEVDLYVLRDGSHNHNTGGHDSSDSIASRLSTAPRGEPRSRNPVASFPPSISQPSPVGDQEAQPETASQASSAGNATPTSSPDVSGPSLPLDDTAQPGVTLIARPLSPVNVGTGHGLRSPSRSVGDASEPYLPWDGTASVAGPSFDANANAETGQGPESPSLPNVDEPSKEEDRDPWEGWTEDPVGPTNWRDPPTVTRVAGPTPIERMVNAGIHYEDAEVYLRRYDNNVQRATDEYFNDMDARRLYFEIHGVPDELRVRLYEKKGDEISAKELWDSIKDVVQLLIIGRNKEETWHFLEEEQFDSNRVRQRLAREAGYGKGASKRPQARDPNGEWRYDEDSKGELGDDEDPDGIYSLDD